MLPLSLSRCEKESLTRTRNKCSINRTDGRAGGRKTRALLLKPIRRRDNNYLSVPIYTRSSSSSASREETVERSSDDSMPSSECFSKRPEGEKPQETIRLIESLKTKEERSRNNRIRSRRDTPFYLESIRELGSASEISAVQGRSL